jgi:cytochrome c oxidase assembly protein subunit 11
MTEHRTQEERSGFSPRRDLIVAGACGFFVAGMVGMAYAAVPFYDWFCRATGFNGTTQVATAAPATTLDRKITVRFDANVAPGLPWRFEPEQNSIEVKLGEVVTVHYRVINEAAREIAALAAYNVAPLSFGAYFQKINCFCFSEQRLKPGEKRDMTVVFFVDPALAKDSEADALHSITLSYTFYLQRDPPKPVADGTQPGKSGRI